MGSFKKQVLLAFGLLLMLSACGGGGGSTPAAPGLSTDATLSALTLSAGAINPAFTSGTIAYTLTTSSATTTVTPTVNQANATVTVNGTAVASGAASASIPLAVGTSAISIVVTAQDGSTTQTYTVTDSRTTSPNTDATLSALTLSAGAINPVFASGTLGYTLTTSSASTRVTPTVNQTNATVTVNGTAVASGAASASIPLAVGITAISVVVTAQDNSTTQAYTVTVSRVISLELLDPTPGTSNKFGTKVVQLANGNIVVSDPGDSSVVSNNGAVHLYSLFSDTPIASIYGDIADDQLGSTSITALANNNYVIATISDDEDGKVNPGTVRLMNGSTGMQIGAALVGARDADSLGSTSITALANNNYVIASASDFDGGSVVRAGSVRLVNGSTGLEIAKLVGNNSEDHLGNGGVIALANNNYVVVSTDDNEGGIEDAGTVRLMNGTTGAQIGATLAGDVLRDQLGINGVTALNNNNYVVASNLDNELGGIVDAGSVRLMNGTTGVQIAMLQGDDTSDRLGINGVTALDNDNYVIGSSLDDESFVDGGSVRLVNGTTGVQIAVRLGDVNDFLSSGGITALGNNNYVISAPAEDIGGVSNAGAVHLVNGTTGVPIGRGVPAAGDDPSDGLGSGGITALGNNNYVISSFRDDFLGTIDAGTVMLWNGTTGEFINLLAGDVTNDQLGNRAVTALGNNNYVISSSSDDESGTTDAGRVRLMNGTTGLQIGATLAGDEPNDQLSRNGITAVNNNYVIVSERDDEGGIVDAGSVRLVNGTTGGEMGVAIIGGFANDMELVSVIKPIDGDYYILSQPRADFPGKTDTGRVRIVSP